jgi:hypothetical protein
MNAITTKNPESQPSAPDCPYLVTLEQRQTKTREFQRAMMQKLSSKKSDRYE